MNRLALLATAALGVVSLLACSVNDGDGGIHAGPGETLDLSGYWPEIWVRDTAQQRPIIPVEGPAPSITLTADEFGFSGSTCYLEQNGLRSLVEIRLAVQGPDVVGGEITASHWVSPVPGDCTSEPPDVGPVRGSLFGVFVWDDVVRVDGSWVGSVDHDGHSHAREGSFMLERNP